MIADKEIHDLAFQMLANQFWQDFSGMVNAYLKAADGLEVENKDYRLQDLTSVFGRNPTIEGDTPYIYTLNDTAHYGFRTTSHETMLDALEMEEAREVFLAGQRLFYRRADGEWQFTGMDEED